MFAIRKSIVSIRPILACLMVAAAWVTEVSAQSSSVGSMVAGRMVSQVPFAANPVEEEVPGLTNPAMPLVFPPILRGELSARPIFVFSMKNEFRVPSAGVLLNLAKDLEFQDPLIMVDCMARAQVARFSLRLHYDQWLTTYSSDLGHLDWPPFRAGGDVDLINTNTVRLGADMDFNWSRPTFSAVAPNVGAISINWDRPVTAGVHLAYNPLGVGGISGSIETRARWPISQNARVTEFEIAAGAKTPLTVLGTSGVRAGWRYTSLELRKKPDFEVDLQWSGVFGEVVYFY